MAKRVLSAVGPRFLCYQAFEVGWFGFLYSAFAPRGAFHPRFKQEVSSSWACCRDPLISMRLVP